MFHLRSLPADNLTGVAVSSAGIVVVVDTGFSVAALSAKLLGAADLVFAGLEANSVNITNSG